MVFRRIKHIVRKEFLQIRRDRMMLRMLVLAPILQLVAFGYVVTTDVKNVPAVMCDMDNTRESREVAERLQNTGYFDIKYHTTRPADIRPLLDGNRAMVGIEIPKGFAKDLAAGRTADMQLVIDGTDSSTASTVMVYANGILQRFSQDVLEDRAGIVISRLPGVEERTRVWYNPDLRSVNYMVPGVLSMILMNLTMIMTALAIVREREIGTLEQLIVTPIRPSELMIGKLIPFIIIASIDVIMVIAVAKFWFRVPIAGSLPLLLGLSAVFLMTSLGLGLFVSTVSRNQQQAMMSSMFIIMPSVFLSGFMFPIENMPKAIQFLTYFIPLRYYLDIVRGIFLKGAGISSLWVDAAALLVFGVATLALSMLRFRKKMG